MDESAKRVLSFAAVSSLPQAKKISLDAQMQTNVEHAARHGATVVGHLVIPGQSRSITLYSDAEQRVTGYLQTGDQREECRPYAKLRELIDADAFDVLMFFDRSRLGRKASLSMAVVSLCEDAGIVVYETDSPLPSLETMTGVDQSLTGAIRSVMAQDEVRKLQDRYRKGMRGRILRGDFANKVPWPRTIKYNEDGSQRLEVDERGVDALLLALTMYTTQGSSKSDIARELNRLGYTSPDGGKWTHSKITNMFRNVWSHAGYTRIGRTSKALKLSARSRWGAIIPEELARAHDDEKARRMASRRGWRTTAYRYTSIAICATCGGPLTGNGKYYSRHDGTDGMWVYYKCAGKHKKASIPEYKLIKAIEFTADDMFAGQPGYTTEQADPRDALRITLDRLDAQEAELRRQLETADDMHITGKLTAERYDRQVERITTELATVANERDDLAALLNDYRTPQEREASYTTFLEGVQDMMTHPDAAVANAWFRKHVRIYVTDGEVSGVQLL